MPLNLTKDLVKVPWDRDGLRFDELTGREIHAR